jgi:hypothetical protein
MDAGHAFLLIETAAPLVMSGVLWTMQILNYPLLARVGWEASPATRPRITAVSGLADLPGVLASLAAAIGLLAARPSHNSRPTSPPGTTAHSGPSDKHTPSPRIPGRLPAWPASHPPSAGSPARVGFG